MEQYSVKGDSWTNDNELYLTYMDSLKNVVGRKQKSSTRSGVARTTGDRDSSRVLRHFVAERVPRTAEDQGQH